MNSQVIFITAKGLSVCSCDIYIDQRHGIRFDVDLLGLKQDAVLFLKGSYLELPMGQIFLL